MEADEEWRRLAPSSPPLPHCQGMHINAVLLQKLNYHFIQLSTILWGYNQTPDLPRLWQYVLSVPSSHINPGQQIPCHPAQSPDTYVPAIKEDLLG